MDRLILLNGPRVESFSSGGQNNDEKLSKCLEHAIEVEVSLCAIEGKSMSWAL